MFIFPPKTLKILIIQRGSLIIVTFWCFLFRAFSKAFYWMLNFPFNAVLRRWYPIFLFQEFCILQSNMNNWKLLFSQPHCWTPLAPSWSWSNREILYLEESFHLNDAIFTNSNTSKIHINFSKISDTCQPIKIFVIGQILRLMV